MLCQKSVKLIGNPAGLWPSHTLELHLRLRTMKATVGCANLPPLAPIDGLVWACAFPSITLKFAAPPPRRQQDL